MDILQIQLQENVYCIVPKRMALIKILLRMNVYKFVLYCQKLTVNKVLMASINVFQLVASALSLIL